jgi:hypothetical protein
MQDCITCKTAIHARLQYMQDCNSLKDLRDFTSFPHEQKPRSTCLAFWFVFRKFQTQMFAHNSVTITCSSWTFSVPPGAVPHINPWLLCFTFILILSLSAHNSRLYSFTRWHLNWITQHLNKYKPSTSCIPIQAHLLYTLKSPILNTLRTGSFKLFKRPFPGFLTILTL